MRRAMLAATLLCLLSVAVPGCASPRDVSTPSKALLGHWRNTIPGTSNDVYYSPDQVTYAPGKSARPTSVDYSVVSEDMQKFAAEVRYGTGDGSAEPTRITFSADRNTMTILPFRIPELPRYEYVDGEQKP